MKPDPTLIVTVLYNSTPVIEDWLAGVRALCAESAYPVVVSVADNASADGSAAELKARLRADDPIRVTAHDQNAGWGAGNNVGLDAARDRGPFAAVVFLNPDVILDASTHDAMRAALDADDAAAGVIPRLRDDRGALRVPAFPDYTIGDVLFGVFGWRGKRASRWQRPRAAGTIADVRGGYPEGSCVMVRGVALESAGRFDEQFFMYFDDTDLGRRLTNAGGVIRYLPDAIATDLPGKGSRVHTDVAENRLDRYVYYLASELRYYAKWFGPGTAARLARYKLIVDLPIRALLWRLRHGIRDVGPRCRQVVREFLRNGGTAS